MKIGIVTFWWSNDNYGQLLQCWALQRQLRLLGHAPYLIRYTEFDRSKFSLKSRIIMKIKDAPVLGLIYKTLKIKGFLTNYKRDKKRNFDAFRRTNFQFSDYYYSSLNDIQENYPHADAYITGSDQVWAHLLNNEYNSIFYLNFGDNAIKRIAYAPSFGMDCYPVEMTHQLKVALSRLDAISCREMSGCNICKAVGYNATHVLDPTILLPSKEYLNLMGGNNRNDDFVYIYIVNINRPEQIQWNDICQFAIRNNYKKIVTTASGYFAASEIFDDAEYEYSTIPQWLSNISKAQTVFTSSFHGVVFSILFHTKFVYFPLEGKFGRGNSRVVDLLNKIGLSDHIFDSTVSLETMCNYDINWDTVDNVLEIERNKSLSFLIRSLES